MRLTDPGGTACGTPVRTYLRQLRPLRRPAANMTLTGRGDVQAGPRGPAWNRSTARAASVGSRPAPAERWATAMAANARSMVLVADRGQRLELG